MMGSPYVPPMPAQAAFLQTHGQHDAWCEGMKYGKSCSAHTILCINCVASVSVSLFLAFLYHLPKRPRCQKKFRTDAQSLKI